MQEREDSHERCSYWPQGRHDSHLYGCGRDGSGNRHRSAAEPHHSSEIRRQGRLSRHSGVFRQEASAASVEGRRGSLRESECRAGQGDGRIPPHGKRGYRPRRGQRNQGGLVRSGRHRRCHGHHDRQGLRRHHEASQLRRPPRLARCVRVAQYAWLHRPAPDPGPRVPGQAHVGPHGCHAPHGRESESRRDRRRT